MHKVTEMSNELYDLLHQAWSLGERERVDALRGSQSLEALLFEGGTVWYGIPDHKAWVCMSGVTNGFSANVLIVSLDDTVEKEAFVETARELMRHYDLRRLTAYVPSPVARVQHRLGKVGFEQEGRLKDADKYDAKYTDLVVFGFYRSEVESGKVAVTEAAKGKTPRKRQRRSRRPKQKDVGGEGKTET